MIAVILATAVAVHPALCAYNALYVLRLFLHSRIRRNLVERSERAQGDLWLEGVKRRREAMAAHLCRRPGTRQRRAVAAEAASPRHGARNSEARRNNAVNKRNILIMLSGIVGKENEQAKMAASREHCFH